MFGNLAFPSTSHDLPYSLDNVTEAPCTTHGLPSGELSAVSVYGKRTFICGVRGVEEVPDITLLAEAGVFEAHGLENRVSVVELGKLHVLGAVARHLEGPGGRHHNGRDGYVTFLPEHVVGRGPTSRPKYVDRRIG